MNFKLLGLTAALALSACAAPVPSADPPPATPGTASALSAYTWQVKSGPVSLSADDKVIFTFNPDGGFSVAGLCNRMGGSYTDTNGQVSFSNVTSTMMACADARRMRVEAEVGGALQKPASAMMTRSEPPQLHLSFEHGARWVLQGAR